MLSLDTLVAFTNCHSSHLNSSILSFNFIKGVKLVVDTSEDLKKARWIAKNKTIKDGPQSNEEILSLALQYEKHLKM